MWLTIQVYEKPKLQLNWFLMKPISGRFDSAGLRIKALPTPHVSQKYSLTTTNLDSTETVHYFYHLHYLCPSILFYFVVTLDDWDLRVHSFHWEQQLFRLGCLSFQANVALSTLIRSLL
jgi:hypothetical protein